MLPRIVTARPMHTDALAVGASGWPAWFMGLHLAVAQGRAAAAEADLEARLRRARAFIDERFHEPIDLDDIARQACLSRYHFLRSFRRVFDVTPHQYLTQKRLERAKELLSESDLPVTEICFEVGFHSLGSFSSLFQRHVGHAPGRYRRRFVQCPGIFVPAIPACFLTMFARPGF
jgi:AraC-like DNA-binding protein